MAIPLLDDIAKLLSSMVISKWEEITGRKANELLEKEYLSSTTNGSPSTKVKKDWSIRDAMLNDEKVNFFVKNNKKFKGVNEIDKISKFHGYTFYQSISLNNKKSCPIHYLDAYSIFIGKDNFEDFVRTISPETILINITIQQIKAITIKQIPPIKSQTNLIVDKNINSFSIPKHFYGIYEGYFIRPQMPNVSFAGRFSKLTLFINSDDAVYVRTTGLENSDEEFENKIYVGNCIRTNAETFQIKLDIIQNRELFQIQFIIDIQSKKAVQHFIGILKGVFSASDPTSKQPCIGRIILVQKENFKNLLAKVKEDLVKYFTTSSKFQPKDLSDSKVISLFEPKEFERNYIRDFFTNEQKYVENIKIVENYIHNPDKFTTISGDYSVYSLHSNGEEINRGVATILPTGVVLINGSRINPNKRNNNKFHKYKGTVNILANDLISIMVYKYPEKDSAISYLFKLNNRFNESNLLNGVRIMPTKDTEHLPFSGRVVLYKEKDGFYDEEKFLQSIPLFPENNTEEKILDRFKKIATESIYNILLGFENNIVKSFGSAKRENANYLRNINYAEQFIIIARFYANNPKTYHLAFVNLYYAKMHGFEKFKILFKEKEFEIFLNSNEFKGMILTTENNNYVIFNAQKLKTIRAHLI